MSTKWAGRRVAEARAHIAGLIAAAERIGEPLRCGQCDKPVLTGDRFAVGHTISRWERPDLTWEPSNWRAEHKTCSDASGTAEMIAKARGVSSGDVGAGESAPLPFSPSEARADLRWSPETLAVHEWLRPLLPVPTDASAPLYMSPVPHDAVGTYGWEAIEWIERTQRITLRWWQRLAIVRQLEHREDGSLCHREVLESAPRRAGKSLRVRGLVLWRMEHGERLFGEVQTIVHTGSDVAICREIQRGAWRWAEGEGWTVTRANGKEAVETLLGARWLVRSQDAVYGYDVCLGAVDEGWKVKPDTVSEGLEPATLERSSPQIHLTSTAHRRATSLMRSHLLAALTTENPETLLLLWAAPHDADPGDPEVWRAASPHWSEDRRRLIADKYARAVAGEIDPQADDLDPMEGFKAQYLNIWRLNAPRAERGEPVVQREEWETLTSLAPFDTPDSAAIESWFAEGCSLVLAWRGGGDGPPVLVTASDHPDLASAVTALRESGFTGTVRVGKSLADDPALRGLRTEAMAGRVGTAVQALSRMVAEGTLGHDGGEHLAGQVLNVRTMPGADGPRMVSQGRADALKAVVWAAEKARVSTGKVRILLPSS